MPKHQLSRRQFVSEVELAGTVTRDRVDQPVIVLVDAVGDHADEELLDRVALLVHTPPREPCASEDTLVMHLQLDTAELLRAIPESYLRSRELRQQVAREIREEEAANDA